MFGQFFVVVFISYKSIVCNICLSCKAQFPYSLQLKICAMLSPFVYNMFIKQFVLFLFCLVWTLCRLSTFDSMFDQFVESPSDCMLLFLLLSIRNDGGVPPNWTQMEFTLPQTIRFMLIYGSQIQSPAIVMNIVFTISY